MKTYYSLLDAVRFFAAFWVMNFHYLFVLGSSSDLRWYRFGNLGVQLFFIISGFVIVQSMRGKTMKEFLKGRFIRLFPLFWLLCTLTYIVTLIIPDAKGLHVSEYLLSMTMFADTINELTGNALRLVDPSYWTLTVELIFYLAIALFVAHFSYDNIRYFLLSWLVLGIIAFASHADQTFIMKLALVRHASYFVFGCALALIAGNSAKNVYEKCVDWGLLIISALYSLYIHTKAIPAYAVPNSLDSIITFYILASFFTGVALLVYISPRVTNTRIILVLAVFGGLTYPLYLLHQTIGNILINFVMYRYDIPWNTIVVFFELLIILVAYIAYLQDKKVRAWLRNKF